MAKLLTTSIERACVGQTLTLNLLQAVGQCTVHAQRVEGMLSYMMRRQGTPVQLPDKDGKPGPVAFKTWYEEWRQVWERWEQKQRAAAGGAGDNGKKDSDESGPEGGGGKGA